jgi:hypothetical protein
MFANKLIGSAHATYATGATVFTSAFGVYVGYRYRNYGDGHELAVAQATLFGLAWPVTMFMFPAALGVYAGRALDGYVLRKNAEK